jgi:hypothetical protein
MEPGVLTLQIGYTLKTEINLSKTTGVTTTGVTALCLVHLPGTT